VNTKTALIVLSFISIYQIKDNYDLSKKINNGKSKADSLENVIILNDSIIFRLKSEYLMSLNQIHKDSVNVENYRKNKPKKLKGLNREELNNKFNDYFDNKRSK
jgi:hypothetical protein